MTTFNNRSKAKPFTMIDNGIINDSALSMKAKGILMYLLSKPEGWQVYEKDIKNHCTDGRESIKSGIVELINRGYMQRENRRSEDGTFAGYTYAVYDEPIAEPEQFNRDGFSAPDKPQRLNRTGKPVPSNIELSNTELSNTDSSNLKPLVSSDTGYSQDFETWWLSYPSERRRDKQKAYEKYKRAIKTIEPNELLRLTKLYALDKKAIGHNGKFAKMPTTFLNSKTYLDYEGVKDGDGQGHNQAAKHSGSSSDFNRFIAE